MAFVIVSQHVHVGIPFLAMPFQPAHHLFAQVVFLVRFFLYDVPEEYLPVLRLRNVGVQFTEQPDLFCPYVRPIDAGTILCRHQGGVDMHPEYPDSLAQYTFPFLAHFHIF